MLASFRLINITKTFFRSLADLCLLPTRFLEALLEAGQPAPIPIRTSSGRRARHAGTQFTPSSRLIVYWPSPRTRPLARAHAVASAFLATDRLPIAKPKVPAR